MRNLRKILHMFVAVALSVNGFAAAHAGMDDAGTSHAAAATHNEPEPPCHDASGDVPPPEAPAPDCCEIGACLCSIAGSVVGAIGAGSTGSFPPEHATSLGDIEQGACSPRPTLLLRPPNA